ncbi:23S rRNA pseudouridine(1911/1915/1917) synthase RluD [Paraferrimonas sp. SM1919]|uniref:23S rRNA pseudouridine(1911/1915/1917) synthase RluD n=1 Tax=Paraferrimonas sp. SM1919 TaxID=2662263 RepID=UPI0013D781EB|nr:23S rRNA pseudouridine(1911/1915/1917) synthase RluD [Paraferrimonas sp. SM1919]
MSEKILLETEVEAFQMGQRLDQTLAEVFDDFSRSRIKEWILANKVSIDDEICNRPREKVVVGQVLKIDATLEIEVEHVAEKIDLNIVYEDDDILVINKPAGLVVHPGAGNKSGTILNALLHHCPQIEQVPRAGIVHRLDKDTTGLMVVAKTVPAQTHLVAALQARNITREYEAIALGNMTGGGVVDEPIGRHPTKRTHMAVVHGDAGKPAVTHYRVAERFRLHTRLRLRLETGRTHQIRVHMAYIKHPLIGDPVYAGRPKPVKNSTPELFEQLRGFRRQALHAVRLELEHPITGEHMVWQAPIPEDMKKLTLALRNDTLANPDLI